MKQSRALSGFFSLANNKHDFFARLGCSIGGYRSPGSELRRAFPRIGSYSCRNKESRPGGMTLIYTETESCPEILAGLATSALYSSDGSSSLICFFVAVIDRSEPKADRRFAL